MAETTAHIDLHQLPSLTESEVCSFEESLANVETPTDAKDLLKNTFHIADDHLNFLLEAGGAAKLREFYFEVIKFDLMYGTNTSSFISEEIYKQIAQQTPNALAAPEQAEHGVRHRSSLTSVIQTAFGQSVGILKNHGIDPQEASLFDLGCGEGKALLIGMSNNGHFRSSHSSGGNNNFPFKRAVGVDYLQDVLNVAKQNGQQKSLSVNDTRPIELIFADAAKFRGFNGVNVIYMYNPFDEKIMRSVEQNIRRYGGKSIVIYNKPEHRELFNKSNGWTLEHDHGHTDPDKRIAIFSTGLSGPN